MASGNDTWPPRMGLMTGADRLLSARQAERRVPASKAGIPRQALPFDLGVARARVRQQVDDALRKGVSVVLVRVVERKQGAAPLRIMERILPDGRVERLDDAA